MKYIPAGALLGAGVPAAVSLLENFPKLGFIKKADLNALARDAGLGALVAAGLTAAPAYLNAYSNEEEPDKVVARALSYTLPVGAVGGMVGLPISRAATDLAGTARYATSAAVSAGRGLVDSLSSTAATSASYAKDKLDHLMSGTQLPEFAGAAQSSVGDLLKDLVTILR